jgi:protein-S-isoprenylcysteine O-methyltransferase Ste14
MFSRNTADIVARIVVIGFFAGLAYRVGFDVLETARFSGVLFLTNEPLVVMFPLTRRFASHVDRSALTRIVTLLGTLGPLLARPDARYVQLAEAAVVPVSLLGLTIVVVGKLSLRRSCGLLTAHQGIVSSGLYRLVRHPIYFGYFLSHGAFLLANASPLSLVVV